MARRRRDEPAVAHAWAVVLAAGDGRRLEGWTRRTIGEAVPKQFCAFEGSKSLLRLALERAGSLVPPERLIVVVAEKHDRWWREELAGVPPANVVVQPLNRGTAAGVLLPLLHLSARDPDATAVFLPSDHQLEQERPLLLALRRAERAAAASPDHVVLLGFRAQEPDTQYGWIVPGPRDGTTRAVDRFHEKPDLPTAEKLLAAGALVNGFLFAARVAALLRLFERAAPALLDAFSAMREPGGVPLLHGGLRALYERLPDLDFSREVLERVADRLRVLPVPACGWTDLGTPERLRRRLARGRAMPVEPAAIVRVA
jgi:mannose-1-phosphate guanylyltransferase